MLSAIRATATCTTATEEIVARVAVLKELCCVPDQSTGETGHGSKETFVTLVKNLTVIIEFL